MNINGEIDPLRQAHQIADVERAEARPDDDQKASNARRDPARLELSDMAKDFSKAVQMLDDQEQVRPDEVERGRELVDNFQPPADEDIDQILDGILES